MNADDLLFTVAGGAGFVPGQGIQPMPQGARDYISAWLATVDHGCGHDAPVMFTAMPITSALCASCAARVGLLDRALRCGRCRAPVHVESGDYAAVVAVESSIIAFLAFCAECIAREEGRSNEPG